MDKKPDLKPDLFSLILECLDNSLPLSVIIEQTSPFNQFIDENQRVDLLVDVSLNDRQLLNANDQKYLRHIMRSNGVRVELNWLQNNEPLPPIVITGRPLDVRSAYLSIRQVLPITVWFDVQLSHRVAIERLDSKQPSMMDIQRRYQMAIYVGPSQTYGDSPIPGQYSVYLRINQSNEEHLQDGIDALKAYIIGNNLGIIDETIQSIIDCPGNRAEILGRGFAHLDPIPQRTGTKLNVQRCAGNVCRVTIVGRDYASIGAARREIAHRFVVELDFAVNPQQSDALERCGHELGKLGDEKEVHILMRPDSGHKTILLRASDKMMFNLFAVRNELLCLADTPPQPPPPVPSISDTSFGNH